MEIRDPYEQYLLTIFESCDDYNQGGLSAAGLQQLCSKLQLDKNYDKLTECLLNTFKSRRVMFHEFKNGLLKLLNEMECDKRTDREISPVKEILPKCLHGKNKYGRHSRADNNDIDDNSSDNFFERQQTQSCFCSTDESTSEDTIPIKRRTKGSRRKERKSGKNEIIAGDRNSLATNTTNEVEHLVTAWSNVSSGGTDSLNREELIKVFQCVGLERGSEEAAQCVFEKLGIDDAEKITLQELLEFIKSGESWSRENKSQQMELESSSRKSVSLESFAAEPMFGCISGAGLIEQWEFAGVPGAAQLLQNLGFSPTQQIDLSSLVSLLSEEIKGLTYETKSTRRSLDPHIALLRANSVLQCLYIQSLKTMVEHVNAEKEKFRNDVCEANQRALLLAQEVDDHHSKLEHSSQQQVKFLEQKHAEKLRDLTNQSKSEQDALMAQNIILERKLKLLEGEDAKNKAIISQLELENKLLEQENRSVVDQLTAVQASKNRLEKDLENVTVLQQKVRELESTMNENDIMSLLERIQVLEKENTNLRDRNDELSVEIEELSTKLLNTSIKKRSNTRNTGTLEFSKVENLTGGGGTKRRGDSSFDLAESAEDSGGEEGSPRLGKVRKCSHMKDFADETTSSLKELEIGDRKEEDWTDKEVSSKTEPSFIEDDDAKEAMAVNVVAARAEDFTEISKLQKINSKLKIEDPDLEKEISDIFNSLIKENKSHKEVEETLRRRCEALENSLEMLKVEQEKTQDYWLEKLEEERIYFEDEQKLSDKKYAELLDKILEYEEMLNSENGQRQRLETIEERESFEKQVADIEQECADLRRQLEETVKMKNAEIEKLKNEVKSSMFSGDCVDSGVQVSSFDDSESLDEKSQILKEKSQNSVQDNEEECKKCADLRNLQGMKLRYEKEIESMRGEWQRLHKEIRENKRILKGFGHVGESDDEKTRNIHLEQKCQSLMLTLRQQQKQTEDILKNTWKQHKIEVNDLKAVIKMTEEKLSRQTRVIHEQLNKLAKTDLLVKDLFVENAYLVSSVQKLEEKCRTSANSING